MVQIVMKKILKLVVETKSRNNVPWSHGWGQKAPPQSEWWTSPRNDYNEEYEDGGDDGADHNEDGEDVGDKGAGPMRMRTIKGIMIVLTLVSGGDGFQVDFTFARTGGFTWR